MRDLGNVVRPAGRLMLAAGLIGFGLIAFLMGRTPAGLGQGSALLPWSWFYGFMWIGLGAMLVAPRLRRTEGGMAVLAAALAGLGAFRALQSPADVAAWVAVAELLGIAAALDLIESGPRRSPSVRRLLFVVAGAMLVLFGAVHWLYGPAIAGMIPDWMPGRAVWPWITGAANIAAGLAIATGVLARPASLLAGVMFASWIVLVHAPRLLAAPGDGAEWVALAMAFALTGVVWTIHGALAPSGEDFQPSPH